MLRKTLPLLLGVAALAAFTPARAQAPGQTVQYRQGWNMVGAPPGTDLSAASTLDVYQSGQYIPSSNSMAMLCQGTWAFFGRFTSLPLTSGEAATTGAVRCPLQAGWNMVGNPFLTGALLPAGTAAYYRAPGDDGYLLVSEIPLGAAVWIYSNPVGSIALQAAPGSIPVITIAPSPSTTTQQLNVGDTIALVDAGQFPVIVGADPQYLVLEASSTMGSSTAWRFRAVAAGSTTIDVSPACAPFGCLSPSWFIKVDIAAAPATASLLITPPIPSAPYQVRAGDTVELKLLLLGPGTFSATVDPTYLALRNAVAQGAEPVRYDWQWLAIHTGSTSIVIDRHGPDIPAQYVINLNIVS